MPPNHEVQDLLAYAPFLFQDNTDDQLRYAIHLVYTDSYGEQHVEHYSIDLATLKEALTLEDAAQMNLIKLSEKIERAAQSLDAIARALDSPDRSAFMQPLLEDTTLSQTQRALLRDLTRLANRAESPSFFTFQVVNDDRAVIRSLGKDVDGLDGTLELRAPIEDLHYLCRVGALNGYYRHGSLLFSLTTVAERLLAGDSEE